MKIDRKVVEGIAELAQLDLGQHSKKVLKKGSEHESNVASEAVIQDYVKNMNNMLQLVEQMQEVDTSDVEPMSNPLDAYQRLRVDEVSETDRRDEYQHIAPETEAGFYLVPKIIE